MPDILMEYTLAGHPLDGFSQASIRSPELNPVPEPGTMLLVGGGVLYLARRRAQRLRA